MSEKNIDKKQNNPKLIIVAVCISVLIIALLMIIVLLMSDKRNQNDIPQESRPTVEVSGVEREVIVKEDNIDEFMSELAENDKNDTVEAGYYQVTMNPTWFFEDGSSPSSNAYVSNAETNTNSVCFDVIVRDTNEIIYKSPVLSVGTSVAAMELDTVLPAGTYDCICLYTLLDEENKPLSDLRVKLTVVIKN